ncbi:MAG: glycosyltransferase, partial [Anaerolineales bacterium]|nr:glycosyltransferase [Anaerolineales bacterium]
MKTCLVNLYDLDPPRNGGMSRVALLVSRILADYDELGYAKVFFAVGWRYSAQFREWLGSSGGTLIPVMPEAAPSLWLESLKPDIVINPLFGMTPTANWNGYTGAVNVASMPDALALDKPHLFSEAELIYRRAVYDQLKQSDLVVTISEHARSRLMHHLDLKQEQVAVIPLAGDDLRSGGAAAQNKALPSSPYVLYPANGWPHKRHDLLLQAMKIVWESRPDVSLVLTGWRAPDYISELAARYDCPIDKIVDLGYVASQAMDSLYRNAEALMFVSEYEGFCMPVLEA